jgi:UDP-galactopyranose mutase
MTCLFLVQAGWYIEFGCRRFVRALIIGGGFAGCAAAHQLSMQDNIEVVLIEASGFVGAGNRTFWEGGHPYTFGPRHFLTGNEKVFNYLNNIVRIRLCPEHEFITYLESDSQFYSYPINTKDIPLMPESDKIYEELSMSPEIKNSLITSASNFEDYWIASIGPTLYKKFIMQYTAKMWGLDDLRQIDTFSWSPKGVALKEGNAAAWEGVYSGYPYAADGYNQYFDYSLKNTRVFLNHPLRVHCLANKEFIINNEIISFDIVVSTVSPDLLFEGVAPLPFIGRRLEKVVLPVEFAFPKNVYFTYYGQNEQYTRVVEYKKFTKHAAASTLIGIEYPEINGRKDYPIPLKHEQRKASALLDQLPENFFSMGRAGSYLYQIDIDDCIEQAIDLSRQVSSGIYEGPVPCRKYHFEL